MLLDEHLTPFLTDFDCSYNLDASIDPPLNIGTASYQSPEMIEGPVTKETVMKADWWAFGCVVFFCFTKRHLFHAQTEYLIFQKVLKLREKGKIDYPDGILIPTWARELIELALIERDCKKLISRLGLKLENNKDHVVPQPGCI